MFFQRNKFRKFYNNINISADILIPLLNFKIEEFQIGKVKYINLDSLNKFIVLLCKVQDSIKNDSYLHFTYEDLSKNNEDLLIHKYILYYVSSLPFKYYENINEFNSMIIHNNIRYICVQYNNEYGFAFKNNVYNYIPMGYEKPVQLTYKKHINTVKGIFKDLPLNTIKIKYNIQKIRASNLKDLDYDNNSFSLDSNEYISL